MIRIDCFTRDSCDACKIAIKNITDAKADNKKRAKYNLFKANPIFDFVKTYIRSNMFNKPYCSLYIRIKIRSNK